MGVYVVENGFANPVKLLNGAQWVGQHLGQPTLIDGNVYIFDHYSDPLGRVDWYLWRLDGTSPPSLIYSGNNGFVAQYLTGVDGKIFFSAAQGGDGPELYVYDPAATTDEVREVKNIDPTPNSGSSPTDLTAVGDLLYFTATGTEGRRLWVSDGTSVGTKSIQPSVITVPDHLMSFNGALFFTAYQGGKQYLYEISAPGATPKALTPVNSFGEGAVSGSTLYVALEPSAGLGDKLYAIGPDGTPKLVLDPVPADAFGQPAQLTDVGGSLYFRASNPNGRTSIWKVYATNHVVPVASNFSSVYEMVNADGTLYADAVGNDAHGDPVGDEIWKVDDGFRYPDPNDDQADVPYEGSVAIDVLKNDPDPDGDPLTVVTVSSPEFGKAYSIDGRTVKYFAPAGFTGRETFSYRVSNGRASTSARITVTVRAPTPEQQPTVAFASAATTVLENAKTAVVPVVLAKPFALPVTVKFAIKPGTAKPKLHYKAPKFTTLTFAPGTTEQDILIALVDDNKKGPKRYATITLSGPTNARLGDITTDRFTIIDTGVKKRRR